MKPSTKLVGNEFAELIRRSPGPNKYQPRAVQCDFGPGWVALQDIPANHWAFIELEKMRGQRDPFDDSPRNIPHHLDPARSRSLQNMIDNGDLCPEH